MNIKNRILILKNLLQNIYFFCIPFGSSRAEYMKKHNILAYCGENVLYQPRKLPSDPKCIKLHSNIVVAADVTFINHDGIYMILNNLGAKKYVETLGCIEICDNCFIGAGAKILPNVKIGEKTIVAAGSIVTKDVPAGSVVAGVPAKVIGNFEDVVGKMSLYEGGKMGRFDKNRIDQTWNEFYNARNGTATQHE